MAIFLEHRDEIIKHNQLYDKGLVSFNMILNAYSDLTTNEFSDRMNGLSFNDTYRRFEIKKLQKRIKSQQYIFRSSENLEMVEPSAFSHAKVSLPKSIDWRQKGAVTAVKDQGDDCGSCWSFSTTGALEGQYFRKTGKLISLSEQNLIDCTNPHGYSKCSGRSRHDAFEWIKDHGGIETEKSYPYKGVGGSCKYERKYSSATLRKYIDIRKGDEKKLQEAIATIGPISIAVDASHRSFQFYSSGIYYEPKCKPDKMDHAVLVVGYGTDRHDRDFYIVKNSWGSRWGESGYMRMSRNRRNNCGVATSGIYPMV